VCTVQSCRRSHRLFWDPILTVITHIFRSGSSGRPHSVPQTDALLGTCFREWGRDGIRCSRRLHTSGTVNGWWRTRCTPRISSAWRGSWMCQWRFQGSGHFCTQISICGFVGFSAMGWWTYTFGRVQQTIWCCGELVCTQLRRDTDMSAATREWAPTQTCPRCTDWGTSSISPFGQLRIGNKSTCGRLCNGEFELIWSNR
jgi:hypothetical protein